MQKYIIDGCKATHPILYVLSFNIIIIILNNFKICNNKTKFTSCLQFRLKIYITLTI